MRRIWRYLLSLLNLPRVAAATWTAPQRRAVTIHFYTWPVFVKGQPTGRTKRSFYLQEAK